MASTKRAILWALCAGGAAIAMTQAAEVPQRNVKLGLWEGTTHPQVNGNLPITDEQLQQLPPDQRAKFEAAMTKLGAHEKLLDHRSDVFIIAAHRDLHVLNGGLRLKRISKPPS